MIQQLAAFLKLLLSSPRRIRELNLYNRIATGDSISLQELLKLNLPFIPRTSYSLSPTVTLHLINEALIYNRTKVLELGTGISTIYLAKAFSEKNHKATIVSIDENPEWQEHIRSILYRENLIDFVSMKPINIDSSTSQGWYNITEFSDAINNQKFDLIVIDAPSTHNNRSRTKVVDYIKNNNILEESYSIFIDDTYRSEERLMSQNLSKILSSTLESNLTYACLRDSTSFSTRPTCLAHYYRTRKLLS